MKKEFPIRFVMLAILASVPATGLASSITYNLTSDWSNISNPNGVWSLNAGSSPLPFVQDYVSTVGGNQNAWAAMPFPQTGHVPVWAQADAGWLSWAAGFNDLVGGDVFVHGTCCSQLPGTGLANVTWTSNVTGLASISGGVWWASTFSRASDWKMYINNTLVSSGNVGSGDPYSRANPFSFSLGSVGPGVLSFNTVPGDVVRLEVGDSNLPGDHWVGVDLSVKAETTSVPEPPTLLLLSAGLTALVCRKRRLIHLGS